MSEAHPDPDPGRAPAGDERQQVDGRDPNAPEVEPRERHRGLGVAGAAKPPEDDLHHADERELDRADPEVLGRERHGLGGALGLGPDEDGVDRPGQHDGDDGDQQQHTPGCGRGESHGTAGAIRPPGAEVLADDRFGGLREPERGEEDERYEPVPEAVGGDDGRCERDDHRGEHDERERVRRLFERGREAEAGDLPDVRRVGLQVRERDVGAHVGREEDVERDRARDPAREDGRDRRTLDAVAGEAGRGEQRRLQPTEREPGEQRVLVEAEDEKRVDGDVDHDAHQHQPHREPGVSVAAHHRLEDVEAEEEGQAEEEDPHVVGGERDDTLFGCGAARQQPERGSGVEVADDPQYAGEDADERHRLAGEQSGGFVALGAGVLGDEDRARSGEACGERDQEEDEGKGEADRADRVGRELAEPERVGEVVADL